MAKEPVQYRLEESVAVIQLDDGKANALSYPVLEALEAALDRADADAAKAMVLAGREGKFCAGFDLKVMNESIEAATRMMARGGRIALRLYDAPRPLVMAVTGHALAMGAILLFTADQRIGAEGGFKIGLNEVAIGLPVPEFALILAQDRLSRRHMVRATCDAEIYDPRGAVDAGFLDRVVPPERVVSAAIAHAQALAGTLNPEAHRITKRSVRGATLERLAQSLRLEG
jgi:enoyl-CoA hydratase